jgi:hypothetical protein
LQPGNPGPLALSDNDFHHETTPHCLLPGLGPGQRRLVC